MDNSHIWHNLILLFYFYLNKYIGVAFLPFGIPHLIWTVLEFRFKHNDKLQASYSMEMH